ncbi:MULTISPECIES: hypothetical protein [Bacteria]|jgi:hypothetical protein|uniref:hypothetical protein n=1 Tax=Bacteria TaxID=2 RepID=UPI0025FBCE47|nr:MULTISPECIES: hypothetical protein [Bacteria]
MDAKIIKDLQDLTYLSWTKIRNSSGTAGSFLKAYDDFGTKKKYYKLSNYNIEEGIVGHESINEIIVDRLLTLLGIPHLAYNLIHANIVLDDKAIDTYVCMSEDFKEPGESKIALDAYFQAERNNGENLLEFCIRQGWEEYIYQMLVIDYLILNRDRHGANIEVLRNRRKKTMRLAPLFDHGLSLAFSCMDEEALQKFDVLSDLRVQCCVGSNSVLSNLKIIPKDKRPRLSSLKETDEVLLMEGLEDILPKPWRDKIWAMIWKRWQVYEGICNQG